MVLPVEVLTVQAEPLALSSELPGRIEITATYPGASAKVLVDSVTSVLEESLTWAGRSSCRPGPTRSRPLPW